MVFFVAPAPLTEAETDRLLMKLDGDEHGDKNWVFDGGERAYQDVLEREKARVQRQIDEMEMERNGVIDTENQPTFEEDRERVQKGGDYEATGPFMERPTIVKKPAGDNASVRSSRVSSKSSTVSEKDIP